MPVSTVLFDADGVIQAPPPDWFASWGALIEDSTRAEDFLKDIFAAELPFLTGGPGLASAVQSVLDKWQSHRSVDDALALWTHISPAPAMLALVEATRRTGASVALATNQQPHRYQFMIESLAYRTRFDHLFVSCEMGVAKPAQAFFLTIIEKLQLPPSALLFIDDNADNVSAAAAVGINAALFHLREGEARLGTLLRQHGIALGE